MSSFTRATFEVTGEKREGRPLYRVEGLTYEVGFLGSDLIIRVPDGFVTDGPSVPAWMRSLYSSRWTRWAFQWLQNSIEKMVKSAAVHDCLREDSRWSKHTGDLIFMEAMFAEKTPAFVREAAFVAVRLNTSRARMQDARPSDPGV